MERTHALRLAAGLLATGLLVRAAAALEINEASRAQLEQLNGIGVPLAARILEERAARGPFRDWTDLERRVKGLRAKTLDRLGAQGLTVAGQARTPAGGGAVPKDLQGAQR